MPNLAATGLTADEVVQRIRKGQVNRTKRSTWRDYANIVARNLFTWFNAMVTPAAIALFVFEEYQGAIAVSGMAIVNTTISLIQEIRAKYHLDHLAILVETKVHLLRDGDVIEVRAGEVVQDDVILLSSGSSVVADGEVLESNYLEVDEALLTGESDPVRRIVGDTVMSGSFCVAGEGKYRADRIGGEAFANATAAEARHYRYVASPLTQVINRLIQVLSFTAVALCVLYTVAYVLEGFPKSVDDKREFVRMIAATITSMVPQGLVLTATLAFTLGAIVMSRRGAIVQRLNAVETMAAVDVICTDKTGTLTTNQLTLDRLQNLTSTLSDDEVRRRLAQFASASLDNENKNIAALRFALGNQTVETRDALPFKSQNRYSAVRIADNGTERILALGACEALQPFLLDDAQQDWQTTLREWLPSGLRIMMFAETEADERYPAFDGALPITKFQPLALIAMSDEMRPNAGDVLRRFDEQGVAFKVISGDNPETVRATVGHLDLPWAKQDVVSGKDLENAANADELIRSRSVFGRVSPHQKVQIVQSLQDDNHTVAMIGDGVNDVLPIKRADLGIAMGEGSQASKKVSGLVLENNDFGLLPETLEEGRTIVRNLRRSAKLFLVKNVYSLILILAYYSGWFGIPFPYLPQQVTLLNWLVIGVPAFAIAISRERSKRATKTHFLREVGWFAIRTGVVFGLTGLVLLVSAQWLLPGIDEMTQRTLLLSTLIMLGVTALLRALADGEPDGLTGDRKFRFIAALALPVYLIAMYWPFSADFFQLTMLTWDHWILVIAAAAVGYGLSLLSDRFSSPLAG